MSDGKNVKMLVLVMLGIFFLFFLAYKQEFFVEGMTYTIDYSNNEIEVDASFNNYQVNKTLTTSSSTSSCTNDNVPTTYTGMNGTQATIQGTGTITVTNADGTTNTYTASVDASTNCITETIYYGPNGGFCKVFTDGTNYFVEVQPSNATMFFLTSVAVNGATPVNPPYTTDPYAQYNYPYPDTTASMFVPKTALIPPICPRCPDVNPALVADVMMYSKSNNNNNTNNSSSNNSSSTNSSSNNSSSTNSSSNNSSSTNSSNNSTNNNSTNNNSSDNWFNNTTTSDVKNYKSKHHNCRPCKPCGRCPEPNFECKKVPNYNIINANDPGLLPITGVGTGYSTFGM
jgi:hypothetical protein